MVESSRLLPRNQHRFGIRVAAQEAEVPRLVAWPDEQGSVLTRRAACRRRDRGSATPVRVARVDLSQLAASTGTTHSGRPNLRTPARPQTPIESPNLAAP